MRYFSIVQYEGTNYQGWQIQPNMVSVQETIEKAISRILNTPTKIYGSGRTDSGVHAFGQTFHFDAKEVQDIDKFRYQINCILPKDIHLISLKVVSDEFHARFSAIGKTYLYILNTGDFDVFNRNLENQFGKILDIEKMKYASKIFIGSHCFQNYTTKPEDEDGFIREITDISIVQTGSKILFQFTGNGFMRYMVRFLVGSLIEVGLGRISMDVLEEFLNSKVRKCISYKADPNGLYLKEVKY